MNIKGITLGIGAVLALSGTALMAHEGEEHGDEHLIPHEVAGINVDGGVTWFMQGSNGASPDQTALTYTLDLNLEKEVTSHGKVVVALEAGDGNGIDASINPLSATNYDAFYTELTTNVSGSTNVVVPSISQAFFEGEYLDHKATMIVGKLDVHSIFDDNVYANDETDQFLSAMFTRSADTTYKQLDYYYAPAIAAVLAPQSWIDVTLIAANGNTSGFDDVFDNMYFVGQLDFKTHWGWRDLEGNYRFYGLQDNRHSFESDGVTPVTVFTDITSGKTTENIAWGLSFDQALPGNMGVFVRYSSQDDGIRQNQVASSWSVGGSLMGEAWGRDEDVIGLAYGSVNINTDPVVLADLAADGNTNPDDETHIEIYYKINYSDHVTITPDIQVLNNIGGNADNGTVTVFGVRGQLNF